MRPDVDESRNPWVTTSTNVAYENPWVRIEHNEVVDPSGNPGIYGVVRPRNWALGVVPVFDNGDILLVGQYRYALSSYSWEIPEGGGAKGTAILDSIQRELAEETGYRAAHWLTLQTLALSNSVTDEMATLWVAWGLTEGAPEPESTEELALWRLPFAECVDLAADGGITDAMTVSAVQALELRRLQRRLPDDLARALAV
jgi:8-oxo-dGTP pyrophosphatase MutT (NUDIX family)